MTSPTRSEVRAIKPMGRDINRKFSKFSDLDPQGNREYRRKMLGQRYRGPVFQVYRVLDDAVYIAQPRAIKRISASRGQTRG